VQALVDGVGGAFDVAAHVRMVGSPGTDTASYDRAENWTVDGHAAINHWREKSHYSRFMARLDALIDAGAALLAADDAPVADAGLDLFVDTRDTVTLDGGDSSDNNFVETWRWRQVAGPRVTLRSPDTARTRFSAPASASTLVFELRVRDAACLSAADRVTVQVRNTGGGVASGPFLLLLLLLAAKRRMIRRYAMT
jgi:hypothetical protein